MFGFDLSKIENVDMNTAGAAAVMAGTAVKEIGKKDLGYGVSHKGVGANTAGTALQGAGTGAKIGSMLGPKGAVIGAGLGLTAGAVGGLITGKKDKLEAENEFRQRQGEAIGDVSRRSRKKYGTLQGYQGSQYFKSGGKLLQGKEGDGSKSVILGGKLHKDGGNDIVKADTKEKIAETEREELLLSFGHTQEVEKLMAKYDETKLDTVLEKLGKTVQRILLNETTDNSGIYGELG